MIFNLSDPVADVNETKKRSDCTELIIQSARDLMKRTMFGRECLHSTMKQRP